MLNGIKNYVEKKKEEERKSLLRWGGQNKIHTKQTIPLENHIQLIAVDICVKNGSYTCTGCRKRHSNKKEIVAVKGPIVYLDDNGEIRYKEVTRKNNSQVRIRSNLFSRNRDEVNVSPRDRGYIEDEETDSCIDGSEMGINMNDGNNDLFYDNDNCRENNLCSHSYQKILLCDTETNVSQKCSIKKCRKKGYFDNKCITHYFATLI